ncbi:hypothetical protein [Nguyenibacter vanlangensis]|uniref:Uncharacterized protein n=1 Tax=Nguyenibacter vanlangensis TaxID=1216886 RepID=A0A7Y7M6K4_9PROT|nr:hypothetical protein [Nguyenibacter vanlangensis]NVN10826.1 hypothetical protein [Nguyenibacter vanlangensis]
MTCWSMWAGRVRLTTRACVRRAISTRYMPISAYRECLDWAVVIADQFSHPLYVVPLNHDDILHTDR